VQAPTDVIAAWRAARDEATFGNALGADPR
jgi:hypothetical protein